MLNAEDILLARIGVRANDLDLDDNEILSDGATAFQGYVRDCANRAKKYLEVWGDYANPTEELLRAEVLLVQREVVLDFGIVEMLAPEEFEAGGHRFRRKRMTPDERYKNANLLLERARLTIEAVDGGDNYVGIEVFE